MAQKRLRIIGTSHISSESLKEVSYAIENDKPDIVALELDAKRLPALFAENEKKKIRLSDIRRIGLSGFIFSLIGAWAEKKLGQVVGVSPGSEMKTAAMLAKEHKIRIALIDQDIEVTLRKISASLTWKERWNFLADLCRALFKREQIPFDLTRVPPKDIIRKLTKQVKRRYPNVYKVLITDRNTYMAKNLAAIIRKEPESRIIAVVGAGHEDEIAQMVERLSKGDIVEA